jgi:anti-anti-sigma factor
MAISHQVTQQDVHLLKLNRPLSGRWAGEVEQAFRDISKNGVQRVIFNMEDVPFIDRHGLSALVTGLKVLNGKGKNLQLVAPQTQPQLVFELTGYDKIFSIIH